MTERISPLLVDKKEKTMIVFEFFFGLSTIALT